MKKLRSSLQAINSVTVKEFIHIYRDWRILVLLLILPPVFTLIFGHAFENTGSSNVPALLENRDQSPQSDRFVRQLTAETTFKWKMAQKISGRPDLLREHVQAALVIPDGWGASLKNGDPIALPLYLDGSDTNTATEMEGRIQESLATFQKKSLETTINGLPEEVIELGKKLPIAVRKEFVSALSQWGVETQVLYNPGKRFIEYVVPGIIGIILQLLTVTLTACTIARERESGTLYQLMVTSLRRSEIVIGKILPYLAISILLILVIIVVAGLHFHVQFHQYHMLGVICLLFLLCSLGLGLLISAFSRTQTNRKTRSPL
jgi:ABC-2 type transport system permease protein